MIKRIGVVGLALLIVGIAFAASRSENAAAFPRGSVSRNITVNPGAIPSGGLATVTVSYLCEASGCFDKGGLGQLTVTPTGVFRQVSTCSFGALGNTTIPGSYACLDAPLSNDALVNFGNARLPANQLLVPPPEPAGPGLHTLQAVVEANAAQPGSTLTICYQEEPVSGFIDPRAFDGTFTGGIDIFSFISRSIPPGDPPSTVVSGASGVYASLCTFILVSSGSPQQIRLLDVTSTNLGIGGRTVIRALVTDQNGNPIPGINVTLSVSDPSQAALTCSTTQDLLAAGFTFNPIFAGSFPGPAGLPSSGLTGNPGTGIQAGQTSLGSPFPITGATTNTLQATPLGSTCYSGTALGGVTGLGTVPPGSVTSLTDNTGVAYVTLVGLASAQPGVGVVVTATVFSGGIPPTSISARSTPFIITGAAFNLVAPTFTVTPTSIVSPANRVSVQACFRDNAGLQAPAGQPVVFTIVERASGLVDAAFAQLETGDGNDQVIRPLGIDGCVFVDVIATGSGTVTVSVAIGTVVSTTVIPVGSGGTGAGQAGYFSESPSGGASTCPGSNQWLGVYWQGPTTPGLTAIQACPNADRLWVRRATNWLGVAPDQPGASDQFDIVGGEFAFLHGRT